MCERDVVGFCAVLEKGTKGVNIVPRTPTLACNPAIETDIYNCKSNTKEKEYVKHVTYETFSYVIIIYSAVVHVFEPRTHRTTTLSLISYGFSTDYFLMVTLSTC